MEKRREHKWLMLLAKNSGGRYKMDAEGMAGIGVGLAVMGIGLSLMSKVMKTTAKTTKKGGCLLFGGFQKTKGTLKW